MTADAPAAPPSEARSGWLFGPVPDLLLGCGLLYAAFFVVVFAIGSTGSWLPTVLAPLLVLLFSSPHYGATIVRVYEERSERRRYALFSVWATVLIAAWFVAGQRSPWIGSAMLTLYLSWSPWHYTGQNYGVAVMMLGRRGVGLDATTKRWLHYAFITSFAVFLCVVHESSVWAESRFLPLEGDRLRFLPLGVPRAVTAGALVVHAAVLLVALVRMVRAASLRELAPGLALVGSQALWFTLPAVAIHFALFPGRQPLGTDVQIQVIFWIAVAHAVQYLWVTAYYARAGRRWTGAGAYAAKIFAAGSAVWLLPAVLFGPDAFGAGADAAALPLLIASAVNLHHFVLDGAIWKLRGPIGKVLIRSEAADVDSATAPRPGLRRLAWGVAGLCAVASLAIYAAEQVALPRAYAALDADRAEAVLDVLAFAGRDSAEARRWIGSQRAAEGDDAGAALAFRRSVDLKPTLPAYGALIETLAIEGRFEEAIPWCDRMLAFAPDDVDALRLAATVHRYAGNPERTRDLLARAAEVSDAKVDPAAVPSARSPAVY